MFFLFILFPSYGIENMCRNTQLNYDNKYNMQLLRIYQINEESFQWIEMGKIEK